MEKRFYTLLYIDKNEIRSLSKTGIGRATNLSFKDRLKMFLGCAALLNKTLQINKVGNLEILTNDIQLLDKLQSDFGYTIKATEIEFSLDVPQGIKWRKRSIPTHLERHNPPTIIAKMGLKRA